MFFGMMGDGIFSAFGAVLVGYIGSVYNGLRKDANTVDEDGHTFDQYTNSGDADVLVKVETTVNDQII